jgi:hypothetical protein
LNSHVLKTLLIAAIAITFARAGAAEAGRLEPLIVMSATVLAADGKPAETVGQAQGAPEPTPEQKMQARFPQPTMVGHLIGLPVLDGEDSTIGYVKEVVKDPDGKIKLIVPYAKRLGWVRDGSFFSPDRRLVAVPLEAVAILALQIDALDMDRDALDKAPTWSPGASQPIPSNQIIKIAIQRR